MFKNTVAEFIYKRTYSRWIPEEERREDWPETIERYITFLNYLGLIQFEQNKLFCQKIIYRAKIVMSYLHDPRL